MGEQAQQLPFRVILQDDGSTKLQDFEKQLGKTTRSAQKSGSKMTRAFSRIGRSIKSVGRSVFSLKGLLIGLATGAVLRSFFGLLRAAGQQEDAVNKLNSALRTAGVFTEEFSKKQQQLASSLQAQTRFGDEAILVAQSLLITYGVTTDRLEEATRATLDFAAATGKDLNTAALTIGKAAAGFTGELGRYGIIVDTKAIPATEVFTAVLNKMNEQFGGRARADVNTFSGRMQQLSNLFGDFREQLGFAVINSVKFRKSLKDLSSGLVSVNDRMEDILGTNIGDELAKLVPTAKDVIVAVFSIARSFEAVRSVLLQLNRALVFLAVMANLVVLNFKNIRMLKAEFEALGIEIAKSEQRMVDLFTIQEKLIAGLNEQSKAVKGLTANMRAFADQLVRLEMQQGRTTEKMRQDAIEFINILDVKNKALVAEDKARKQREAEMAKPISPEELGLFRVQDLFLQLSAARQQQLLADVAFTDASTKKQFEIISESLKAEQDLRRANRISAVQETATLLGSVANLLEATGSASFKTIKKFRIAEAIINGIAAVQQALASLPFPANVIAAASVAVLTAANVAAIRAAQPGGGGGAVSVGAPSGGGPAAPGEISAVAVQEERITPSIINISVSGFVGDEGELGNRIGALLRDFQSDGGEIAVVT